MHKKSPAQARGKFHFNKVPLQQNNTYRHMPSKAKRRVLSHFAIPMAAMPASGNNSACQCSFVTSRIGSPAACLAFCLLHNAAGCPPGFVFCVDRHGASLRITRLGAPKAFAVFAMSVAHGLFAFGFPSAAGRSGSGHSVSEYALCRGSHLGAVFDNACRWCRLGYVDGRLVPSRPKRSIGA